MSIPTAVTSFSVDAAPAILLSQRAPIFCLTIARAEHLFYVPLHH
jgi:hypothetical protein